MLVVGHNANVHTKSAKNNTRKMASAFQILKRNLAHCCCAKFCHSNPPNPVSSNLHRAPAGGVFAGGHPPTGVGVPQLPSANIRRLSVNRRRFTESCATDVMRPFFAETNINMSFLRDSPGSTTWRSRQRAEGGLQTRGQALR